MHQLKRAPDSITLSWPQPDRPNGDIIEYQLRYYDKVRYSHTCRHQSSDTQQSSPQNVPPHPSGLRRGQCSECVQRDQHSDRHLSDSWLHIRLPDQSSKRTGLRPLQQHHLLHHAASGYDAPSLLQQQYPLCYAYSRRSEMVEFNVRSLKVEKKSLMKIRQILGACHQGVTGDIFPRLKLNPIKVAVFGFSQS